MEMIIDPKKMFPRVSPLAGNKPRIARTVFPDDNPRNYAEWYYRVFLKHKPVVCLPEKLIRP